MKRHKGQKVGLKILVNKPIPLLLLLLPLPILYTALTLPAKADTPVSSTWATTPPSIDGLIGWREWSLTTTIVEFNHGVIAIQNDAIRLYILIDAIGDTVEDPLLPADPWGDYFSLTFDVNEDSTLDANIDMNYGIMTGTEELRYQYYIAPSEWTYPVPGPIRSSSASGFDCFWADGTFSGSQCTKHSVWEFGIDLAEITAAAGEHVRMGVRVHSQNPHFEDDIPAFFYNDFSNLIDVSLASPPTPIPTPDPNAQIHFEADAIEITQATQTRQNTVQLIGDKRAVARLYVYVDGVTSPQPSIVYLHGKRDFKDLPGSPLSTYYMAPTTPNRDQLTGTANFNLPKSWLSGNVEFHGNVRLSDKEDSSAAFSLDFEGQGAQLVQLYVPIRYPAANMITPCPIAARDAAGNCTPDNRINQADGWMRAVYPVSSLQYVALPTITSTRQRGGTWNQQIPGLDGDLATLQNNWEAANPAPSGVTRLVRIYGWLPSGTIDNGWGGGQAYGDENIQNFGTIGDVHINSVILSHEVGHTLGLPHPRDDCSSTQWNSPYTAFTIQQVGFYIDVFHLKPSTMNDYMTGGHCVTANEEKFVGPNSWNLIHNSLSTAAPGGSPGPLMPAVLVSGIINRDGTGSLNPLYQTQAAVTPESDGPYFVEMVDSAGEVIHTHQFDVQFPSSYVPAPDAEETSFSFYTEYPPGTVKVNLWSDHLLDTLLISDNAPTVQVTFPNGGENLQGWQKVTWQASDADGDPLTFIVQVSNDGGTSWNILAIDLTNTYLDVNFDSLGGGTDSLIRILASDGMLTASDTSDSTFSIPSKSPLVTIITPKPNALIPSAQLITFRGDAADFEDSTIPEEAFLWSYRLLSEGGTATYFGIGSVVDATLPDGVYEITLSVTDSDGNMGRESIIIRVGTAAAGAAHPHGVGGVIYDVDRFALLMPLLTAAAMVTVTAAILLTTRRRQR